ncbi:ceramide kinase-like isoform X1 [Crassostrea angulata]|uniref:ceramide kinase-like isoform X1 n=1 Tax=Magallana angulata TaxID=2784310 RepID=UPI0022B152D0|nr:ceramide kinase-like isoform X1 [Crassostrea angulata]
MKPNSDETKTDMDFINSHLICKSSSCEFSVNKSQILKSCVHERNGGAFLEVHYVAERNTKLTRRRHQYPETLDKCLEIHKKIQNTLADKRPKRLLVLINPRSGSRKAEKIYAKRVLPVFELCEIQTNVIVTHRANEVKDLLMNIDLEEFDGVVAVGGDGIYNEVVSGLTVRELRDHGQDPDNPESKLSQLKLPIGIIPAGSGNYTAWYLNGTKCPVTAALRIVMGHCVSTNIVSLHQGNKCSGYSGLILGFGLFGDVMRDCEKYRWMGTSRFKVIPVGSVLNRRPVNVSISYIPTENKRLQYQEDFTIQKPDFLRLTSVPVTNRKSARDGYKKRTFSFSDTLDTPSEWKTAEDRVVYAVDTYPITMKPDGTRMTPNFGGNTLELLITTKCKLADHFRQLKEVDDGKSSCYDFEFVKKIEVQRYRVRVLRNKTEDFYLNCDGEVIRLEHPEFDVRLHKQVVQLYGKAK